MKKFTIQITGKTLYTIFAENPEDAEELIKDIGAETYDTFAYETVAVDEATDEELAAYEGDEVSTKGMA